MKDQDILPTLKNYNNFFGRKTWRKGPEPARRVYSRFINAKIRQKNQRSSNNLALGGIYTFREIYFGLYTKTPLLKCFAPPRLALVGLCTLGETYFVLYTKTPLLKRFILHASRFDGYVHSEKQSMSVTPSTQPQTYLNQGSQHTRLAQPSKKDPMGSPTLRPNTNLLRL